MGYAPPRKPKGMTNEEWRAWLQSCLDRNPVERFERWLRSLRRCAKKGVRT